MKKSHERFGEIIREHFDNVQPEEFKARLHEASHGTFGEPSGEPGNTPQQPSKLKRVRSWVVRVATAAGNRMLSILHIT